MADIRLRVAVDLGGDGVLVDISDRVRSVRGRYGRGRGQTSYSAGTARVDLHSDDNFLTPGGASTYSADRAQGGRAEVSATIGGGDVVAVFTGWVDAVSWSGSGTSARASLELVDGFARLSQAQLTAVDLPAERTGERVARVLDLAGYPTGSARNIDAGTIGCLPQTVTGSALELLRICATTEGGRLAVEHSGAVGGVLRFAGRAPIGPVEIIVTDDPRLNTTDLTPAAEPETEQDPELVANATEFILPSGELVTSRDDVAVARYGLRTLRAAVYSSADDAQDLADWTVDVFASPAFRVRRVDVAPHFENASAASAALDVTIGSVVDVAYSPPSSTTRLAASSIVDGVEFSVDALDPVAAAAAVRVRWSLLPAATAAYWLLGDAVAGRLGDTTRLGPPAIGAPLTQRRNVPAGRVDWVANQNVTATDYTGGITAQSVEIYDNGGSRNVAEIAPRAGQVTVLKDNLSVDVFTGRGWSRTFTVSPDEATPEHTAPVIERFTVSATNVGQPLRLLWVSSDADATDTQTGFEIRRTIGENITYASTPLGVWTTYRYYVFSPSRFAVIPAGWGSATDGPHRYAVRVRDQSRLWSPYSEEIEVTPVAAPMAMSPTPTITMPKSGSVPQVHGVGFAWTFVPPPNGAAQIQVVIRRTVNANVHYLDIPNRVWVTTEKRNVWANQSAGATDWAAVGSEGTDNVFAVAIVVAGGMLSPYSAPVVLTPILIDDMPLATDLELSPSGPVLPSQDVTFTWVFLGQLNVYNVRLTSLEGVVRYWVGGRYQDTPGLDVVTPVVFSGWLDERHPYDLGYDISVRIYSSSGLIGLYSPPVRLSVLPGPVAPVWSTSSPPTLAPLAEKLTLTWSTYSAGDSSTQAGYVLRRRVGDAAAKYLDAAGVWGDAEVVLVGAAKSHELATEWAGLADPVHHYAVRVRSSTDRLSPWSTTRDVTPTAPVILVAGLPSDVELVVGEPTILNVEVTPATATLSASATGGVIVEVSGTGVNRTLRITTETSGASVVTVESTAPDLPDFTATITAVALRSGLVFNGLDLTPTHYKEATSSFFTTVPPATVTATTTDPTQYTVTIIGAGVGRHELLLDAKGTGPVRIVLTAEADGWVPVTATIIPTNLSALPLILLSPSRFEATEIVDSLSHEVTVNPPTATVTASLHLAGTTNILRPPTVTRDGNKATIGVTHLAGGGSVVVAVDATAPNYRPGRITYAVTHRNRAPVATVTLNNGAPLRVGDPLIVSWTHTGHEEGNREDSQGGWHLIYGTIYGNAVGHRAYAILWGGHRPIGYADLKPDGTGWEMLDTNELLDTQTLNGLYYADTTTTVNALQIEQGDAPTKVWVRLRVYDPARVTSAIAYAEAIVT